ncbi:MAG: hypothetical protein ACI9OW_001190, partial [Marinobacter psychrophilus]
SSSWLAVSLLWVGMVLAALLMQMKSENQGHI